MKCRMALLMLCVVLALFVCTAAAQETTDNILFAMADANTREALTANNERVAYRAVFSFNDGTTLNVRNYIDKEKCVYEEDGYLEVNADGKAATYWADSQTYATVLFVGDAYEQNLLYRLGAWYQYEPTEKVTQITEENGKLLIEAEITDGDVLHQYAIDYGFEAAQVKRIVMNYVIDAQDYEIYKLVGMGEFVDGSTHVYMEVNREEDVEAYMIPDEIKEIFNCKETRSITLIENPGTDTEKADTYQVPRGVLCQIAMPIEYDPTLYSDASFTKAFESNGDYTADVIGYIRK